MLLIILEKVHLILSKDLNVTCQMLAEESQSIGIQARLDFDEWSGDRQITLSTDNAYLQIILWIIIEKMLLILSKLDPS